MGLGFRRRRFFYFFVSIGIGICILVAWIGIARIVSNDLAARHCWLFWLAEGRGENLSSVVLFVCSSEKGGGQLETPSF